MTWRRRVLFGLVSLLAVGIDGLSPRRVTAAGPSSATVSILRNPKLAGVTRPGDFNGDGILDVVATAPPAAGSGQPKIVIALGKGDGGLATPVATTFTGAVEDVDDVNGDGKLDLLIDTPGSGTTSLFFVLGNGDGTFTTVRPVGNFAEPMFAKTVDLDGDGFKDILLAAGEDIEVVPGDAAGTYPGRISIGTVSDARGVAIGDFNHDGRPDFAVSNFGYNSITIFHNQGSLAFGAEDITITPGYLGGLATADLNGDGKVDLVVAVAEGGDSGSYWDSGRAVVLLGNGDGTFGTPLSYDVARGAWEIVVGDFTRDGIVDIATANRSAIYYDALCVPLQTWDSVSILPGKGDGTFAAPSNFSIGNQLKSTDPTTDRNTVSSLAAADLNGDHALDLVVSNGTVFLIRPADPNWAPRVDAGPDQTVNDPGDHFVHLYASASDVDQDMLTYAWFDSGGDTLPPVPSPCFSPHTLGVHTYTVVVDDGHGHTASDSVVVDFGSAGGGGSTSLGIIAPAADTTIVAGRPYEIKFHIDDSAEALYEWSIDYSTDGGATRNHIWECHNTGRSSGPGVPDSRDESCTWQNPGPPSTRVELKVYAQNDADQPIGSAGTTHFAIQGANGAVPEPWRHQDIGAVAVGGSATASDPTTFDVTASGADIWGTADEFHFLYQEVTNVVSPADSGAWEITTRVTSVQNTDPWTKAGLMIREGLGASARHASVFVSPGKGIAFQRRASTGSASVSTAGPLLTAPVWLKLGVQSGIVTAYYRKTLTDSWTVIGRQTFTEFSSVDAGMAVTSHHDGQPASAEFANVDIHVDPAFVSNDIGTTGGSTTSDGVITTMTAKGADVWGTSDQFRYASVSFDAGSGSLTARVVSVEDVNAWTKAGVMFRETTSGTTTANAKYVFVMVTPGKGATMQFREATGGSAASIGPIIAATAPGWVRLTRSGDMFTGSWSKDGVSWTTIGGVQIAMAAGGQISAGLAVTSHDASAAATAQFSDIVLVQPQSEEVLAVRSLD